jgi:hypothetical protein
MSPDIFGAVTTTATAASADSDKVMAANASVCRGIPGLFSNVNSKPSGARTVISRPLPCVLSCGNLIDLVEAAQRKTTKTPDNSCSQV